MEEDNPEPGPSRRGGRHTGGNRPNNWRRPNSTPRNAHLNPLFVELTRDRSPRQQFGFGGNTNRPVGLANQNNDQGHRRTGGPFRGGGLNRQRGPEGPRGTSGQRGPNGPIGRGGQTAVHGHRGPGVQRGPNQFREQGRPRGHHDGRLEEPREPGDEHNRMERNDRPRFLAFRTIETLSQLDSKDILASIATKRDGFNNLIDSPVERHDVFVLLIQILSKLSQSPFVELKSKLILDVCNSNFISNLRNYLMDLPYAERKSSNNLYWKNQTEFWQNFIIFCEDIFSISPATATRKCRALIESISKTCLDYLNQRHGFVLPQEYDLKLNELRAKLTTYDENKQIQEKRLKLDDRNVPPPEDFRQLSLMPTVDDLMVNKPFLRSNVVEGGYDDVEHYLDVQFRLLREDCFGPLREGIGQYLSDPNKRKYDHIRVFKQVKFVYPHISNLRIGTVVQIDTKTYHNFKKINWAHNKRFLFGSLVIFTKDNCKTLMLGTILDRDPNLLSTGKLPVALINTNFDSTLYNGETYTMIESEVYFEPYYHVMKALQAPSFPQQLSMQQYIVHVDPAYKHPAYLTIGTEYKLKNEVKVVNNSNNIMKEIRDEMTRNTKGVQDRLKLLQELKNMDVDTDDDEEDNKDLQKYKVLQLDTWPTKEQFKLNESQYEAYRLALTHEFAVIQGPPGTGKTYIAIQVAKTLLENIKSNPLDRKCLMLIVCYTNHALDQFFEAISKVTKSMVRIGGQSRNAAIEEFNLNKLRSGKRYDSYFMEEKINLRRSIQEFQDVLMLIDVLNDGVASFDVIEQDIPEINLLGRYYGNIDQSIKDPLHHWLFEYKSEYYADFNVCMNEIEALLNNEDVNDKGRTEMVLEEDDNKNNHLQQMLKVSSFYMPLAKHRLKCLAVGFRASENFEQRYKAQTAIQDLYAEVNLYGDMVQLRGQNTHIRIHDTINFAAIRMQHRWMLYFKWIENKLEDLKARAADLQVQVAPTVAAYEEARMMVDVDLILSNRIKVVGMTTSGAAKMRKLLEAISPKIVIVEEAAEVLEQHIITSLTKDCEHLILIGDHQQLRPSASYMKLARHYNIEVSLFERMIKNGIHSCRLNVQHRMRPEIAALICPHIYKDLQNHPSVEYFDDMLGMEKNLFFFSHDYQEEEGRVDDSASRTNHKEADMTLALANYIMQQGYSPEDVTILAAYSGQMFYMRNERKNYAALTNVKITVVDNYQGEESKIILLSLVRNNSENKIGFLGTENRICVALSRAKQGFYIFGNIDSLKLKSPLWQKIAATLEDSDAVGNTLKLKCQNHPDQKTDICNLSDFTKVPEGGCLSKCNFQYGCGHLCLLFCHGYDRQHVTTKCTMKCERLLCDLEHVCPLRCREECQPCKVKVRKTLPCTHEMDVHCYLEPDDPAVKCGTRVEVTLPDCGHKAEKSCHMQTKDVKCLERCVYRLAKCGHVCSRFCHVNHDPEHEKYICMKPCARAKKGCTAELVGDRGEHQCRKACHEDCDSCNVMVKKKRSSCKHYEQVVCSKDPDEEPCKKKCARTMDCGHYCKKKCSEECGDCKIIVTKEIPDCRHSIKIECMKTPSRELCTKSCTRTLPCGHPCKSLCGQLCDPSRCLALSSREVTAPCGHKVKLPCNITDAYDQGRVKAEELLEYCSQPCGTELACAHACAGTCARCRQGRLHAPCLQPCRRLNICGHECQEPCNQICPPCAMACEVKCPHSHCKNMCGDPCTPCQEECSRRCEHGACTRRCGEPCDRAPCDAPCRAALPCGHACRGLCGEPCPAVCRACRPDDFPRDFLGDEYDDDERFILLQDCGHIMEVENMDNLMLGDQESIKIRTCPFCRKPIINTIRYKDVVNNTFRNEINPIKTKVYGTKQQISKKRAEFIKKFADTRMKYAAVYTDQRLINDTQNNLTKFIQLRNKLSLLEIEMLLIYLDIFEMIVECCAKYAELKPTEKPLDVEIQEHIKILLSALKIQASPRQHNIQTPIKISEQQQKDLNIEIKRLSALVQFSPIFKAATYLITEAKVKEQTERTKATVVTMTPFDEDAAIESMQILQKLIKQTSPISKHERDLIIKAIGLQAGHWYKCPNGHLYSIGDCGRAVQGSICPECGASIGGIGYHVLAPGNRSVPIGDLQ